MSKDSAPKPLSAEELANVREWLALPPALYADARYAALWNKLPSGSLPERLLATIDDLQARLRAAEEISKGLATVPNAREYVKGRNECRAEFRKALRIEA